MSGFVYNEKPISIVSGEGPYLYDGRRNRIPRLRRELRGLPGRPLPPGGGVGSAGTGRRIAVRPRVVSDPEPRRTVRKAGDARPGRSRQRLAQQLWNRGERSGAEVRPERDRQFETNRREARLPRSDDGVAVGDVEEEVPRAVRTARGRRGVRHLRRRRGTGRSRGRRNGRRHPRTRAGRGRRQPRHGDVPANCP